MITSMTGFGHHTMASGNLSVTVELKSVNHRFCEIQARIPRPLLYLEEAMKERIYKQVDRGRIELFATVEGDEIVEKRLTIDWSLLEEYVQAAKHIKQKFSLPDEVKLTDLLQLEHVANVDESANIQPSFEKLILDCIDKAAAELKEMRANEGLRLKEDCLTQLEELSLLADQIEEHAKRIATLYRERLLSRIKEWTPVEMDESRLIAEVALFAERADITEELTRLKSHFQQMRDIFHRGGTVGRKLDFLVQELNREANTIGSKANDHKITNLVVEMKSRIEKIKEQVQNIE
ncbi:MULTISPECIES: YicC/YloC family endoribonuclease [Bacillus]|uniref:Stress-induced protein n=2 Tax=Bacillus TaxID=1386 RepID=A0A0M5JIG1_9BACI|nr:MULTISPECIES: YicC/YloC family endoribonuclease [Bacillus]ALC81007.1 hypothetical protein AM592_04930 [Bacillus gobiensis]MBP1079961.1 uncharacterized protein (TIGR00255 family) [Bacillus capparidis]MED1095348.1 YicC family protein [Bacillus capparidis]